MFDRIRAMIRQWQDVEAVAALDDRALADLGVSRDQAAALARLPAEVPARMAAMAAIFGVTEAVLRRDHAQWVEAMETCGHCGEGVACRRMLDRARVLDGSVSDADVGFCPNAGTWRRLAG